jgi:Ca-activated chloride channel family protein
MRVAGQAQQAPQGNQAPQPAPSFRAGVDVVSLNVTVTDGTARYLTDLQEGNFSVFEDGVKQDVTLFSRTNLPIALAILLDTSASMETKLPVAQEAAVGFAKRLRKQDLAEVVSFDSRVIVLQPFTNTSNDLEQAIRKTSAGGSTSLNNAVYIALKDLKKVVAKSADEVRRQALVVLSDGEDTSSLLPFQRCWTWRSARKPRFIDRAESRRGRIERTRLQRGRIRHAAVRAGDGGARFSRRRSRN